MLHLIVTWLCTPESLMRMSKQISSELLSVWNANWHFLLELFSCFHASMQRDAIQVKCCELEKSWRELNMV